MNASAKNGTSGENSITHAGEPIEVELVMIQTLTVAEGT
jgi:hypothetical protein